MSKIVDSQGKQIIPELKMDNALFRWILLILLTVAAKVISKDEAMNIYTLINKEVGHSQIIDGFHTQLLSLMTHGEKINKKEGNKDGK